MSATQEGPRVELSCRGCKHHNWTSYRVQGDSGVVHRCKLLGVSLGDLFSGEPVVPVAACPFKKPALTTAIGWEPITTAPLDGREVLLRVEMRAGIPGGLVVGHYMRGGHCIEDHREIAAGWYFWNGCQFDMASKPTHWMPLPGAPS